MSSVAIQFQRVQGLEKRIDLFVIMCRREGDSQSAGTDGDRRWTNGGNEESAVKKTLRRRKSDCLVAEDDRNDR
jgi:hypothetical protein